MGARRARAWSRLTVAAVFAAGGCYEGFDPLDPEVLAEVARTRGDAQGFDRSGVYMGPVEVLECGCTEDLLGTGYDLSLCDGLETLEMLGIEPELQLELVQADGTVRVRAVAVSFVSGGGLFPVFYGPLHADGRISTAGVLQADAVAAQGQVLGRIDGTLDGPDGQWTLVGEYQQRYAVDLISQADVLDVGFDGQGTTTSVDCRERLALELSWSSPPYEPIDG